MRPIATIVIYALLLGSIPLRTHAMISHTDPANQATPRAFTTEEATALAQNLITTNAPTEMAILKIDEKSFGWVFYYNSKAYADTSDPHQKLIGLGPLLIDRQGHHEQLPSAPPATLDTLIAAYETKWAQQQAATPASH